MTMHIAAYGRLGRAPKEIPTKTGTVMAACSLAVSLQGRSEDEQHTQWLDVLAFGRVAEDLLRHQQGDIISVSGRVAINAYQKQDGTTVEALQVIADTVISARTVRPKGGGKRQERGGHQESGAGFDDAMPF